MFIEILKLILYSFIIVLISKYILVRLLRKIGESLNLSPKLVGEIAGFATSIPELLTVVFSSITGLVGTSTYNILSSNIINSIQYIFSLKLSNNSQYIKSNLIKTDLLLVFITIVIPIILIIFSLELTVNIVLTFILFFIIFYRISFINHRKYSFQKEENKNNQGIKIVQITKYFIYIILVGTILFLIGNKLGDVLLNLSIIFNIPEFLIGIILGFITSVPELISFFESQKHYTKNKENDELGVIEATNNLLISNMFNLFIIQSIGIIIFVANKL